jgi:hypothetical protein
VTKIEFSLKFNNRAIAGFNNVENTYRMGWYATCVTLANGAISCKVVLRGLEWQALGIYAQHLKKCFNYF